MSAANELQAMPPQKKNENFEQKRLTGIILSNQALIKVCNTNLQDKLI